MVFWKRATAMFKTFSLKECWNAQWKILTLAANREELLSLNLSMLPWGLFFTLLAGIGRAWDNPEAEMFMRTGLPSVGYIFVLSAFLFFFIAVLRPKNWSYQRLLVLVSMTALPGLLYAVPLEMMFNPETAAIGNTFLLFLVGSWRVLILGLFLLRTTDLNWSHLVVALFLPLCLIINLLIALEKFEKTFGEMGGIRRYFLLVDQNAVNNWKKIEAERRQEAYKRNENYYPKYVMPSPYKSLDGKTDSKIFVDWTFKKGSPVHPGFKEISWDDSNYLPPGPLMFVLRPIGKVSSYAAPLLFLYYLWIGVTGFVTIIKNRHAKSSNVKN
jgi:hypothetical protein